MKSFRWPAAVVLLAATLSASCGGGSKLPEDAQSPADATAAPFRVFAAALQTPAVAGAASAPPSADERAEIQARSRERAVAVLAASDPASAPNVFTVPPLHFALAQLVDLAARGDTLAALRREIAPVSSTAVQAGLLHGLSRHLRAGADTTINSAFMRGAALADQPGSWAGFSLDALAPERLAAEPHLRLAVYDAVSFTGAWPQATPLRATWLNAGTPLDVAVVNVKGPLLRHAAAGFEATGLALADGAWLVRITPDAALKDWGANGLGPALAQVVQVALAQPASSAPEGELVLPVAVATAAGLGDRPGMALAMDQVNADLRGLDGGGSYLDAPAGSASLSIGAGALAYWASQSVDFIFSPRNIFGGGFASSGRSTIEIGEIGRRANPPPCPDATVELRPFYLALIQPSGNIAMLARLAAFEGTRCQVGAVRFGAWAQAHAGAAAATPAAPADNAEINQRSRQRAAQALNSVSLAEGSDANVFTVPPLFFALTQAVDSAARGDTLAALRQAVPPASNAATQAGLVRGLSRQVRAEAATVLQGGFLDAIALDAQADAGAAFGVEFTGSTISVLSIEDKAELRAPWQAAEAFRATWQGLGERRAVPMLRVQGLLVSHAAPGFEAAGLALPAGGWLIKITPAATLADWGAEGLDQALAQLASSIATRAAASATLGELELPALPAIRLVGAADRPGMALAMDQVNANLVGLDGGGTYVKAPPGVGSLSLAADALSYSARQSASFVYSASNLFGPGGGLTIVDSTRTFTSLPPVTAAPPSACPETQVALRPFYLAWMQPSGNVAMLARLASFTGDPCQ